MTPAPALAPAAVAPIEVQETSISTTQVEQVVPPAPQTLQPDVVEVKTTVQESTIPLKTGMDTVTKGDESIAVVTTTETVSGQPQNLVPDVSSPF